MRRPGTAGRHCQGKRQARAGGEAHRVHSLGRIARPVRKTRVRLGSPGAEEMTPAGSNARFYVALGLIGGLYIALILAMVGADWWYWVFESSGDQWSALQSEDIVYSIKLSL